MARPTHSTIRRHVSRSTCGDPVTDSRPDGLAWARFITSEHWRLHQTFPAEVWAATQPFSDLIRAELEAGIAGWHPLAPPPERDAWLMTKTIIGAYHHYAFQPEDPAMATLDDDVWYFCLAAAGGSPRRS